MFEEHEGFNGCPCTAAEELLSVVGAMVKQSTVPKLPCPVTLGSEDRAVMREVVGFYHDPLKKTPEAQRYLESAG